MPFLTHLCAQNGESIEDIALRALARLTTLRSLNLKGCRWDIMQPPVCRFANQDPLSLRHSAKLYGVDLFRRTAGG